MRAPAKLHYAWIVAAVTFVVLLLTAGIRAAPGVLIVPLEDEFHWSRSTISFAVGVNLLLYGLIGPFAAALIDRFGVRRTMAVAAGQLIFLPTMASLVTHAGWRPMSLLLAGTVAAFVPLIALLMRDRPEDLGLAPYGDKSGARPAPVPEGNPLTLAFRAFAESARSRDFWLIAGSYFVCGASTNGLIGTHLIPACIDHGLAEVAGAGLLAATGVFSFFGGTLSGWLSDRWDNRLLLAWYYGLRGLSLLYLPFAFDMSVYGLSLFTVFYGLDWIAGVPSTVRLLTRVVGIERTGIMVAWITVIHQVGGASAAYLGGVLRISFGTYLEAFLLAGLLCFGAALMSLLIGGGIGTAGRLSHRDVAGLRGRSRRCHRGCRPCWSLS